MPLSNSNTFNLPSQGSSISISRTQFNISIRSLLQNFYSSSKPDTENFQVEGEPLIQNEINGSLYRDSSTGSLYISDSAITTASGRTINPIGGSYTKYGINWRQEYSLTSATSNLSSYDIGEAFLVAQNTGGSSNNRLYIKIQNTGTFNQDIVDIGLPAPDSITTGMLKDASVTSTKINDAVFTTINSNVNTVQSNVASNFIELYGEINHLQDNITSNYNQLNSNINVVQNNVNSLSTYANNTFATIANSSILISGTAQSMSGVNTDFTGLPANIKRITIMYSAWDVSSSTTVPTIRLGYGGTPTYVSSGYSGAASRIQDGASTQQSASFTAGFDLFTNGQLTGAALNGMCIITRLTGNTWVAMGNSGEDGGGSLVGHTAGSVTLSGDLTAIRCTSRSGVSSTGTVNILYE
jgi:hypothetical protein